MGFFYTYFSLFDINYKAVFNISQVIIQFFISKCGLSFRFTVSSLHFNGRSSLINEKDHHYFLNRFVCVGEFFDG